MTTPKQHKRQMRRALPDDPRVRALRRRRWAHLRALANDDAFRDETEAVRSDLNSAHGFDPATVDAFLKRFWFPSPAVYLKARQFLEHIQGPALRAALLRYADRVTNIILDHRHAALIALRHLVDLGHQRFAFMKGPPSSSDTDARWEAICQVAGELGIEMKLQFAPQTEIGATPEPGYEATKEFLEKSRCFTALFAYNDLCAIGAIRALDEAGLRVPEDVSVVGFDDIPGASYSRPSLTTVRQPMQEMGQLAARTLPDQIEKRASYIPEIAVEPKLIVRRSTWKAPSKLDH